MRKRFGKRRPSYLETFWMLLAAGLVGGCGAEDEHPDPQMVVPMGIAGATAVPPTGNAGAPPSSSAGAPAGSGARVPGLGPTTAGGGAGAPAQTPAAGASAAGTSALAGAPAMAGAGGATAGSTAAAGSGAAGSAGSAGAGAMVPSGANNFVSVCEGGTVGMDSVAAKSTLRGLDIKREYSGVKMLIRSPNEVLSFKTTLQVPKPPTQRQTLFVWPGLQSRDGAADPGRVGNGVLQPVLTWGSSCAPKRPSTAYDGWWIAGMYVKTGCQGGDYLTTNLGDLLEIDMFLKDGKWVTTIRNVMMEKTVDFTIDLKGQVQNEVMWLTEVPDGSSIRPVDDVIWTQNVLTFKNPEKTCQPNRIGSNDYFSAPVLSKDGLHCCWDKIIMRAER